MKTIFSALAVVITLLNAPLVHAADSPTAAVMTDAEVRKVDKAAKKITLKHEAIKSLDMPAMTMVFQVRDADLLNKVKPGDKVQFSADNVAGAFVVTAIVITAIQAAK